MKKSSTLNAIVLIAMFLISSVGIAQSAGSNPSEGNLMYLATEDITVEKFQALQNLLKSNTSYAVKEACVPAHVMSVKILRNVSNEQALTEFKSILNSVDIHVVSHKADYNDTKFLQKCSSARTAN